jgi:hypothetical protein
MWRNSASVGQSRTLSRRASGVIVENARKQALDRFEQVAGVSRTLTVPNQPLPYLVFLVLCSQ